MDKLLFIHFVAIMSVKSGMLIEIINMKKENHEKNNFINRFICIFLYRK